MKRTTTEVNYIQQLSSFYEKIAVDNRLSSGHITVYLALFMLWNQNRFKNPISICRNEVKALSKINSSTTYSKVLNELNEYGYIDYTPSYNPLIGSLVYLFIFCTGDCTGNCTGDCAGIGRGVGKGIGRGPKEVVIPPINYNKHNKHNKHINNREAIKNSPPTPDEKMVMDFFKEKGSSEIEAMRFFNHFESNGWLVGGKSKMKNWKAAAQNWISRSNEFSSNKNPNQLAIENNKNYSEPL